MSHQNAYEAILVQPLMSSTEEEQGLKPGEIGNVQVSENINERDGRVDLINTSPPQSGLLDGGSDSGESDGKEMKLNPIITTNATAFALKKSDSLGDNVGSLSTSAPRKLKKIGKPPSKPRLSIDALGPLIVDRTELQSPINLDHEIPEVAEIVVASLKSDLVKQKLAYSNRNLTASTKDQELGATSQPPLAYQEPSNDGGKGSTTIIAATTSTATISTSHQASIQNEDVPSYTPSFITQVTQQQSPSTPIQRPNIQVAVQKTGTFFFKCFF